MRPQFIFPRKRPYSSCSIAANSIYSLNQVIYTVTFSVNKVTWLLSSNSTEPDYLGQEEKDLKIFWEGRGNKV